MDKIYQDAKDKYVTASLIYAKNGDTKAYSDSACTKTIDVITLKNIFEQGCIVIDASGIEYRPISYHETAGVGTITYVKTDGSTATTAVLAILVSTAVA